MNFVKNGENGGLPYEQLVVETNTVSPAIVVEGRSYDATTHIGIVFNTTE